MSWDRPWEPSPETRQLEAERERRRQDHLDLDLVEAAQDLVDLKDRADAEREKAAHMQRLLDRKRELLADIARTQRARTEAEKEARAAERRVEFERQRAERLGRRTGGPRNGRAVRIDVDDAAWGVLRRTAVERRCSLLSRVGQLVMTELEAIAAADVTGPPSSRWRRSPGEGEPTPRRRFLRVWIDDESWTAFRLAGIDLGLTAERYLGELAEAEAHRLGWRAV